jgi:hypothetical protein
MWASAFLLAVLLLQAAHSTRERSLNQIFTLMGPVTARLFTIVGPARD